MHFGLNVLRVHTDYDTHFALFSPFRPRNNVYHPAPDDIYLTISHDLQLNLVSQVEIISELFIM